MVTRFSDGATTHGDDHKSYVLQDTGDHPKIPSLQLIYNSASTSKYIPLPFKNDRKMTEKMTEKKCKVDSILQHIELVLHFMYLLIEEL